MEFNKVSKEIFEPIKENKKMFEENFKDKLSEIFPSTVKDGQVDFKALLEELGEYVDTKERYELTWAGKQNAKKKANEDIVGRTLKYIPEDSKNRETTENLYIEGDNLEVLKLLRNSYYNKVKMIYIDPPYNTGNDFVYNDDFSQSEKETEIEEGDVSADGRFIVNQKSSGKFHSNWLNMMYLRLKIAKDLLSEDGVIFISVDDNEVDNLKKICNEILGEDNFVAQIIVQANKGGQDYLPLAKTHEYVLCYFKSNESEINLLPKNDVSSFKFSDDNGKYEIRELRNRNPKFSKANRPNLYYPIYVNPDIKDEYGCCAISLEKTEEYNIEVYPLNSKGNYSCWRWSKDLVKQNVYKGMPSKSNVISKQKRDGGWNIYEKNRKMETKAKTIWDEAEVRTEQGTIVFRELFNNAYFDHPKPVELVYKIIQLATNPGDLILDFFSGSSTTAHAVMKLNAEDNGKRKFIMIQIPETCDETSEAFKAGFKNICEIGKERIRRAGQKIIEENKDKDGIENLDVGFKVFKAADTNIRWFNEAMKGSLTPLEETTADKDKLDFNDGFTDIDVVYEILLRHRDIPLSSKVENLKEIGKRTYMFADVVVTCLETEITEEIVDKIAAIEPMPIKIIFRDSAFGDNISLKENTMIRLEAQIKKNSGIMKKSYRIEFI